MGEPTHLRAAALRSQAKSGVLALLLAAPGVDAVAVLREILAELEPEEEAEGSAVTVDDDPPAGPDEHAMNALVRRTLEASDTALSIDTILDRNGVRDPHERGRWKRAVGGYGKLGPAVHYDIDGLLYLDRHDPAMADGFDAKPAMLALLAQGPTSRAELFRSNGRTYQARRACESALTTLRKRGVVTRLEHGVYALAEAAAAAPTAAAAPAEIQPPRTDATVAALATVASDRATKADRVRALLLAEGPLEGGLICARLASRMRDRARWRTTLWTLRQNGHVRREATGRYALVEDKTDPPAAPLDEPAPPASKPKRAERARAPAVPKARRAAALPAESQAELLQRIVAGDAKAWQPFWRSIEKLVRMLLRRCGVHPHEMADAEQDVQIHLHRVAAGFDPSRGGVTTWVGWQVRAASRHTVERRETIHVPAHLRDTMRRVHRGDVQLEELAEQAQRNVLAARATRRLLSTETPIGAEGGSTLLDTLPANDGSVEDAVALSIDAQRTAAEHGAVLRAWRDRLDERERAIYDHRLAVDPADAWTLEAVGRTFDISRERVRQIEVTLRSALKKYLVARLGSPARALAGYR